MTFRGRVVAVDRGDHAALHIYLSKFLFFRAIATTSGCTSLKPFNKMTETEPYSCDVHGLHHDIFISYRADADEDTAKLLHDRLTAFAKRRHGQPPAIFFDKNCIQMGQMIQNRFLSAMENCRAVIFLLSQASMQTMIDKVQSGYIDSVVLELETALDLKDDNPGLHIFPLAVATKENRDGSEIFHEFKPFEFAIPDEPQFQSLRETIDRLNSISMGKFHPNQMYKRISFLSNRLSPRPPTPEDRIKASSKYQYDSNLRVDHLLLDALLQRITLTGRAFISGMGGIGKSVLALQFVRFMMGILDTDSEELSELKNETIGSVPQYSQIFLINCSTETTALSGLQEIFPGMKAGEIKKHAAKVFAESSGYLLILDNGDDIDVLNSVFGESRKHGFGGDVIVTSRAASIAEGAFNQAFKFKVNRYTFDPLMIMPWSQEIAFDYVMKQCPKLSNKAKSRESIAKVKNLISRIYSNNLVLHTFIFFFDSNTIPLAELERAFGQVLNRNHGETDAQLSLRAIVTMTLDGEMNKGPTGHATCCLYSAICYIGSENIPYELIKTISEQQGRGDELMETYPRLIELALLNETEDDMCRANPLKQQIGRSYANDNPELFGFPVLETTGRALIEFLGDPRNSFSFDKCSHFEAYLKQLPPNSLPQDLHFQIELTSSRLDLTRGHYHRAQEGYTRVLDLLDGSDSPNIITKVDALMDIAKATYELNQYSRAREYLDEAKELCGVNGDVQSKIYVAHIQAIKGDVAIKEGSLQLAKTLYSESIGILKEVYGNKIYNQDVAETYIKLGKTLERLNDRQQALETYKIVSELEPDIGESYDKRYKAEIYSSMAAIDLFQDCPDDAIRNRLLAIKELKEFHGEVAHPSIAKAHIDLAETLASHKQYEDANMQYDEAIRVYEKSFYTRNIQEIATALYNKAHVFMDKWDALSDAEKGTSRNELMSAIKLLQEALKIISLVKEVKDQAHQKKIEELKRKAREEDCKMDRPLIEACRYYAKAFNQYFVNDEAPVTAENHNHVNFLNEDQASSVSHKHSAVSSATVGGQESPNEVRGYQTGQRTGETHLPNTSTLQIEIEVGDRVEDQPPAYSSVILENASIVDFTRKLTSRDERASTVSIAGRD